MREALARHARPVEQRDWVYLNNFTAADRPLAFGLPAGQGARLRDAMAELVRELKVTLPAAFEAEGYATEIERVQSALVEQQNEALQAISDEAMADGIGMLQTPNGLSFAPVRDGEVMPPDQFNALSEQEQAAIRDRIRSLEEKLQRTMREGMRKRREQVGRIEEINRETARFATEQAIEELRSSFASLSELAPWFEALQQDLLEHFELFLPRKEAAQMPFAAGPDFGRYEVNLLTSSSDGTAPVVLVDHPTLGELLGRVEYRASFGMLSTDFRLIKPGKLHLANGGTLLVEAWRLLAEPFAWDALKRTLQRGAIRIESVATRLAERARRDSNRNRFRSISRSSSSASVISITCSVSMIRVRGLVPGPSLISTTHCHAMPPISRGLLACWPLRLPVVACVRSVPTHWRACWTKPRAWPMTASA